MTGKSVIPLRGNPVRCLGPGKEHFFFSKNRFRQRICGRCSEKIRQMSRTMAVRNQEGGDRRRKGDMPL